MSLHAKVEPLDLTLPTEAFLGPGPTIFMIVLAVVAVALLTVAFLIGRARPFLSVFIAVVGVWIGLYGIAAKNEVNDARDSAISSSVKEIESRTGFKANFEDELETEIAQFIDSDEDTFMRFMGRLDGKPSLLRIDRTDKTDVVTVTVKRPHLKKQQ
ncbi:hypothetical protein [Aeromicrobium sp. 179-A 4D2 NHS]|uniref:hypothetical protein n=1 Tax=Aeromicrobium sp. 179-A 4D2 NHS TaxID=3142375 RepID=UPI0039A360DD